MHILENVLGGDYALLMFFLWVLVGVEYEANIHKNVVKIGSKKYNLSKVMLRLFFFVLWFMAAFRGMDITNDTSAYYETYRNIAAFGFLGETRMEFGYVALNVILSKVFSDISIGFYALLFITTVISYFALEQWIERHANSYGICIIAFYFLTSSSFMSAIRQSLACAFVLWALMIWEKNGKMRYLLYYGLCLVAISFHQSAIVSFVFPLLARMKYTKYTTLLILLFSIVTTMTNAVSHIIAMIGLGTGYIASEIGNATNVAVMSFLFLGLLCLRAISLKSNKAEKMEEQCFNDSFYTFFIALSLAVTIMSLRAPGMSRLNMYFQLIGLPYISNVLSGIRDRRIALVIKVIFAVAVWSYSVVALIYKPEWQHVWPYHFYWE